MTQNVSDKTILELWRSPQFSASYRGIRTFKRVLFTDLNIDISEKRLYNILKIIIFTIMQFFPANIHSCFPSLFKVDLQVDLQVDLHVS